MPLSKYPTQTLKPGTYLLDNNSMTKEVSYSDFEKYVATGGVEKITIYSNDAEAIAQVNDSLASTIFNKEQIQKGTEYRITTQIPSADKIQEKIDEWNNSGVFTGSVKYEKSSDFSALLWSFGPIVLLIVFWFFLMRRMSGKDGSGGGVFSVGKSKAKIYDKDNSVNVTFKDVAGLSEAKTEIEEIVEFLKNPSKYTEMGAHIPRGILLVGPPGTGKTYLAKAASGEAGVPFFSSRNR